MPIPDTSLPPPPKAPAKRSRKKSPQESANTPDLFERLDWTLSVSQSDEEKAILLSSLFPVLPICVSVPLEKFAAVLSLSFSLSFREKKRVFDSMPELSQFQVDELIKTMEDERREFLKLVDRESEPIFQLYMKSILDWAIFLYGTAVGSMMVLRLVQQAIPNGKAFWIPERCGFDATQPYFWLGLLRSAIFAGATSKTVEKLMDLLVNTIGSRRDDRHEFEILNGLYSDQFQPNWDGRLMCDRRVRAAEQLLSQVTMSDDASERERVVYGRSFALGVNQDYEYLGRADALEKSIVIALTALDPVVTRKSDNDHNTSPSKEGKNRVSALLAESVVSKDAEVALSTTEMLLYQRLWLDIRLGRSLESLDYRKRLFSENSERIDPRLVHALTFSAYGTLNASLLRGLLIQSHNEAKLERLDLIEYALNWLCWVLVIGDVDDIDDCIDANYNLIDAELTSAHGNTANGHNVKWRSLYASARFFQWIVQKKNEAYSKSIDEKVADIFGEDAFFSSDRSPQPETEREQSSLLYRCVRTVEAAHHELALIEEIKTTAQRYDACFYLYVLANCVQLRSRCREVARTVAKIPSHRLSGIRFDESVTGRFQKFLEGEESYGGAPDDVDQWKGNWVFSEETGFTIIDNSGRD